MLELSASIRTLRKRDRERTKLTARKNNSGKTKIGFIAGTDSLSALIRNAAAHLKNATTAAEILDARDIASLAYDAIKRAVRLAQAKRAHDEIIAKTMRAQALEIKSAAKRRLANEYDAAQERGEVVAILAV